VLDNGVADQVNDPALEDPIGQLLVELFGDGGRKLMPLAKVVGSLGLGTIGLFFMSMD
jgi:hypothetical protein